MKTLLILSLCLVVVACGGGKDTNQIRALSHEEISLKLQSWNFNSSGRAYRFEYILNCFCANAGVKTRVTVNSLHQKTLVELLDSSDQVSESYGSTDDLTGFFTIEELFLFMNSIGAQSIVMGDFDDMYSFPKRVQIFATGPIQDENFDFSVSSFQFL